LFKSEVKEAQVFWQEFEESTGEKVLKRGMGKYISGWGEFDKMKERNISGLVIVTSGGFRFHYYPQRSWFDAITRYADSKQQKEIIVFIPQDRIISCDFIKEEKLWRKILLSAPPLLVIRFKDEAGSENQLVFEAPIFSEF